MSNNYCVTYASTPVAEYVDDFSFFQNHRHCTQTFLLGGNCFKKVKSGVEFLGWREQSPGKCECRLGCQLLASAGLLPLGNLCQWWECHLHALGMTLSWAWFLGSTSCSGGPVGYLARRRPRPEPRWRSGSPGLGRRRWRLSGPTCSHTPSPTGRCSRSPRGPRWRSPHRPAACHRLSRLWALKGEQRSARMEAGCWAFIPGRKHGHPTLLGAMGSRGGGRVLPKRGEPWTLALNTPSILEGITPWEE